MTRRIIQNYLFYSSTPSAISGLSSYTDSSVSAYARTFPDHRIVLHTNVLPGLLDQCRACANITIEPVPPLGHLPFKLAAMIRATGIAWKLRRSKRPLVSTTPFVSPLPLCRQIYTIHDLYGVDISFRGWHTVLFWRVYLRLSKLFATRVIAVSDTTAEAARPFVGALARRILVLKEASRLVPLADDEINMKRQRGRLLMVANLQQTKNFGAALDILVGARERGLVVALDWVGRDPAGYAHDEIGRRGGPVGFPNLNPLGVVSEEMLENLYANADALLVTSWAEGFCLPVLEAQARGCPVIASDIPVLREVAGPSTLFFPPDDPQKGVDQLATLLSGHFDRNQARLDAVANARRFSWEASARMLEAALEF